MIKKNFSRAGSEAQYGPRLAGEILHDYLENSNEPLAVAYRERQNEAEGWKPNTHLCVDVKTFLRKDHSAMPNREYPGWLKRDKEDHFVFVEMLPPTAGKRNPHVFNGQFITVTRRDDGSYRLNFKPLKVGADFSLERYALGVYNEIRMALEGLIEGSERVKE